MHRVVFSHWHVHQDQSLHKTGVERGIRQKTVWKTVSWRQRKMLKMHKLEQPKRRARIAPIPSNLSHSLWRGLLPFFIHLAKDMCSFTDLEQDGQDDRSGSFTIPSVIVGKESKLPDSIKRRSHCSLPLHLPFKNHFFLLNKLRTLSYILAPPFWVSFKRGLVGSKWLPMQWFHFIWSWRGRRESENKEKLMSQEWVNGSCSFEPWRGKRNGQIHFPECIYCFVNSYAILPITPTTLFLEISVSIIKWDLWD